MLNKYFSLATWEKYQQPPIQVTKLKCFLSSHGLERMTDFTTHLPDLTSIFHFHDNDLTVNKDQLNAYNLESEGLCQGLSMRSINNSPFLHSLFWGRCWRLTKQPHHSLLLPFTCTLPPSRQSAIQGGGWKGQVQTFLASLAFRAWVCGPAMDTGTEGTSAETGVRNGGNSARRTWFFSSMNRILRTVVPFSLFKDSRLKHRAKRLGSHVAVRRG